MEDKTYKLYASDLRKIASLLPAEGEGRAYGEILRCMADTMLHDDAICGDDSYFDRQHGV